MVTGRSTDLSGTKVKVRYGTLSKTWTEFAEGVVVEGVACQIFLNSCSSVLDVGQLTTDHACLTHWPQSPHMSNWMDELLLLWYMYNHKQLVIFWKITVLNNVIPFRRNPSRWRRWSTPNHIETVSLQLGDPREHLSPVSSLPIPRQGRNIFRMRHPDWRHNYQQLWWVLTRYIFTWMNGEEFHENKWGGVSWE